MMKILCIDNDPDNLEKVSSFLAKRYGCPVLSTTSSDQAIFYLMQNKDIHLVLSELKLLEGDGEKVWNHLRRNGSDIPFVWMTSPASKKNKIVGHSLVESPINQFLSKPVNEIGIISVVETLLHQREKKKEIKIIPNAKQVEEEKQASSKETISELNYREEQIAKARQRRLKEDQELEELVDLEKNQAPEQIESEGVGREKKKQEEIEKFNREQKAIEAQIPEWTAEQLARLGREVEDEGEEEELQEEGENDTELQVNETPAPVKVKRHVDWNLPVADFQSDSKQVQLDWDDHALAKVGEMDPNQTELPGKEKIKMSEIEKQGRSMDSSGHDPLQWDESMLQGEIFDSDGYVNEPIGKFLNYNTMVCDLYIRLSSRKILKIVNKGDLYERALLEKYLSKGVEKLYLHEDDHAAFQRRHGNFFRGRFLTKNYNHEKRILNRSLNSFTYDQLYRLGVSKNTINIGQRTINESLELIRSDSRLLKDFCEFVKSQNDIVNHSILLSYICMHICIQNGWDAEVTLQELCLAALFHDYRLEDINLATVGRLDDEKLRGLNEAQLKAFRQHPERAAAYVVAGEELYPNVTTIIRQHHESPDGLGFPARLKADEILPLACIFIIAEDFVHRIFRLPAVKIHKGPIQEEMRKRYHHKGNFHKIYEGFEKAFFD